MCTSRLTEECTDERAGETRVNSGEGGCGGVLESRGRVGSSWRSCSRLMEGPLVSPVAVSMNKAEELFGDSLLLIRE